MKSLNLKDIFHDAEVTGTIETLKHVQEYVCSLIEEADIVNGLFIQCLFMLNISPLHAMS